ncbi:hypothetical protein [Cytobacillus firmus]|uniref:hypothetical protein n=1 Tax=Cytobacillus firmus TaxID=1399 RepID=UPI002E1A10B2|nr:hypothetical protein [Cytobacillus firmus]
MGDKDSCFIVERLEKLKNIQNLILKVIEGRNHSLELHEEPIKSIEVLKSVISFLLLMSSEIKGPTL